MVVLYGKYGGSFKSDECSMMESNLGVGRSI